MRFGRASALWHRRSLRVQLLIIFVAIDFIAALVAGSVTILKARTATRVEIAASMELAELLVGEAVNLMQQEVPAERFLDDLSSQLRLVRHVRIGVKDAAGNPLAVRLPGGSSEALRADERASPPSPGTNRSPPLPRAIAPAAPRAYPPCAFPDAAGWLSRR
jgi:hypothetical protein